ncbi:MAG: Hpt domain-containing protein [Pseudodesulfovibrio sp.]|nr:Hpt domain-containing protein [Pseudodesulfovibrio sp.]
MEKFQVIVDPDLKTILPRYIEILWEQLSILEQSAESGDSETACILGHKLKGTGSSYGFNRLTELGAAIETASKSKDFETTGKLATKMRNYLENAEIIYGK